MSKENNKKEVVKRLSSRERREDIVKIIREIGLWRLPSQQRLAERYDVSQQQISKDINRIFTTSVMIWPCVLGRLPTPH